MPPWFQQMFTVLYSLQFTLQVVVTIFCAKRSEPDWRIALTVVGLVGVTAADGLFLWDVHNYRVSGRQAADVAAGRYFWHPFPSEAARPSQMIAPPMQRSPPKRFVAGVFCGGVLVAINSILFNVAYVEIGEGGRPYSEELSNTSWVSINIFGWVTSLVAFAGAYCIVWLVIINSIWLYERTLTVRSGLHIILGSFGPFFIYVLSTQSMRGHINTWEAGYHLIPRTIFECLLFTKPTYIWLQYRPLDSKKLAAVFLPLVSMYLITVVVANTGIKGSKFDAVWAQVTIVVMVPMAKVIVFSNTSKSQAVAPDVANEPPPPPRGSLANAAAGPEMNCLIMPLQSWTTNLPRMISLYIGSYFDIGTTGISLDTLSVVACTAVRMAFWSCSWGTAKWLSPVWMNAIAVMWPLYMGTFSVSAVAVYLAKDLPTFVFLLGLDALMRGCSVLPNAFKLRARSTELASKAFQKLGTKDAQQQQKMAETMLKMLANNVMDRQGTYAIVILLGAVLVVDLVATLSGVVPRGALLCPSDTALKSVVWNFGKIIAIFVVFLGTAEAEAKLLKQVLLPPVMDDDTTSIMNQITLPGGIVLPAAVSVAEPKVAADDGAAASELTITKADTIDAWERAVAHAIFGNKLVSVCMTVGCLVAPWAYGLHLMSPCHPPEREINGITEYTWFCHALLDAVQGGLIDPINKK